MIERLITLAFGIGAGALLFACGQAQREQAQREQAAAVAPAQPLTRQDLAGDLAVVHDDQRGVTCWVLLYGGTAKGISCLGDGEFRGMP
jgi:hypothetical protein